MILVPKGRRIYVTEYTQEELTWLQMKLTWGETVFGSDYAVGDPVKIGFGNASYKNKIGTILNIHYRGEYKYKIDVEIDGILASIASKDVKKLVYSSLLYSDGEGIFFLKGTYKLLKQFKKFPHTIEEPKIEKHVIPEDIFPPNPDTGFEKLFPFQHSCASKAVSLKDGLCILPTSSGKTLIILAIIRYLIDNGLAKKMLIVVPTTGLVTQLISDARETNSFNDEEIGAVWAKEKNLSAKCVVTTKAFISTSVRENNQEVINILDNEIDTLILDETQRVKEQTNVDLVFRLINIERIIGFSGSPFREDEFHKSFDDSLVYSLTGGTIFQISYKYLKSIGRISEAKVFMKSIGGKLSKSRSHYNKIYDKYIAKNTARNDHIVKTMDYFMRLGFQVLVLVQRREHAETLMNYPLVKNYNLICLFGGNKSLIYDEVSRLIEEAPIDYETFREQMNSGALNGCIATQVADEGLSMPGVGAVIMGGGGKNRISNLQRLGRGLRRKKIGASVVYIVDFDDKGHIYTKSHSKKRLGYYVESGCEVIDNEYNFNNIVHNHALELETLKT